MILKDEERILIKYYFALLEISMKKINKLEMTCEDSERLDDCYSKMYDLAKEMSTKIEELQK